MPIMDASRAPRIALRDPQGRLDITRVAQPSGDLLRVRAFVRGGPDEADEPDSVRFEALLRRIEALLPGAGDRARAELDTAVRAGSQDGRPLVGKTRPPHLSLKAGTRTRRCVAS